MLTIDIMSGETGFILDLLKLPIERPGDQAIARYMIRNAWTYQATQLRTVGTDSERGQIVVISSPDKPDGPVYVQWTADEQELLLLDAISEGCPDPVLITGLWFATYGEYRGMVERWLAEGKQYGNHNRWFKATVWEDMSAKVAAFNKEFGDAEVAPTVLPKVKAKAKAPTKKRTATRRKK